MSLGHFLLEQGMEVELKAEIGEVISLLDSEVARVRVRRLRLPYQLREGGHGVPVEASG